MLKVESLACRRGRRLLFHNIAFTLEAGDVFLLTGRNGSGKSSLLRILAGLLPALKGKIFWGGKLVADQDFVERFHYIGHTDAVKPELTAAEMADYWQVLRGISRSHAQAERKYLQAFDLMALADRKIRQFSTGQKRRLALTRLFLTDAPLWLLDEPMTSLDPKGQDLLIRAIGDHRAKGGIAIIATHHGDQFSTVRSLNLDELQKEAA